MIHTYLTTTSFYATKWFQLLVFFKNGKILPGRPENLSFRGLKMFYSKWEYRKMMKKRLFLSTLFLVFSLTSALSFANFEKNYLICFKKEDLDGLFFQPLMYYFEDGRAKSYVLNKQITNDSIVASHKEYRVERNVDEKYKTSGKRFVYWQEENLTFLYNLETNTLKTRLLDEDKEIFRCTPYSSKNSFIRQVKKWRKLHNLREPPRLMKKEKD